MPDGAEVVGFGGADLVVEELDLGACFWDVWSCIGEEIGGVGKVVYGVDVDGVGIILW